jgi:heparanase 1
MVLAAAAAAAALLTVAWPPAPLRHNLSADFISINIDSASIAQGFDFSDPVLATLVKQLAPTKLRVGGTASHGLVWTGAPGACGCCGPPARGALYLSTTCFDALGTFAAATGARLVFDFAPTRAAPGTPAAPWNASDAAALFAHAAAQPYAAALWGWQVGNEDSDDVTTGAQLGRDFLTVRALARAHGLGGALVGPSLPKQAYAPEWLADYANATFGALDLWAVHIYAGVDKADATGRSFVERATYAGWGKSVEKWVAFRDAAMAPTTGVNVEETAAAVIGGIPNATDRYIDGFYWLTIMGAAGVAGAAQVNRQDFAGWSFIGRPSNYQLAGPPGWTNGSAALRPRPDYYSTVLWKQLMGPTLLNATAAGAAAADVTVFASCAAAAARAPRGAVALAYINGGAADAALAVPALGAAPRRVDFALSGSAAGAPRPARADAAAGPAPLPADLWSEDIFLNGVLFAVDARGALPAYPVPGAAQPAGAAPALLAGYSYGFVLFPDAAEAACM